MYSYNIVKETTVYKKKPTVSIPCIFQPHAVVSYKCPQWFYYVYSPLLGNNRRRALLTINTLLAWQLMHMYMHPTYYLMKNEPRKGQIKNLRDSCRNKKCGASKCVPKFNMSPERGGEGKKWESLSPFRRPPPYNILRQ